MTEHRIMIVDDEPDIAALLEKALQMDVISQAEYDEKVAIARKKLDNFEEIKRVEKQLEMNLITREEYAAKMQALTQ